MTQDRSAPKGSLAPSKTLTGIGLAAAGYAMFAIQDATVKWLVATYAVPQILFVRSVVIVVLVLSIGRTRDLRALAASQKKAALAGRATLILAAWLLYYSAARSLGLAQLTTLYFAAPIVAVALSVLILKERVNGARWLAVLVGFGGVVLAANPERVAGLVPSAMALLAACFWGLTVILARIIARTETTANQMVVSNLVFVAACALALPWVWRTPDASGLGLMLGLGVVSGLGQYCLFEGFRYAGASVLAPIEYTGLVWAFIYGFAIWHDVPAAHVFWGAGIIVASSLALIWFERRASGEGSNELPPRARALSTIHRPTEAERP